MKNLILIMLLVSVSFNSLSQCFPKNNLKISVDTKSIKNVTEEEFLKAVDDMNFLYAPLFSDEYGSTLEIEANWQDATVNAYAQQVGNVWKVSMFGGLARHPETTLDGFRAVICHEIGHHIGGAPKKPSYYGVSWASNEGQSDYFATSKCLAKFFSQKEQLKETYSLYKKETTSEEDKFAKQKCSEAHSKYKEKAICFRSALAGKSLARLLGSLRGNAEVMFSVPDPKVVGKTNHNHPEAQCRMDTYFQGALCVNDLDLLTDPQDVRKGYCTLLENFKIGVRPSCWYAPSEYEK